jgi:hypothetical protein
MLCKRLRCDKKVVKTKRGKMPLFCSIQCKNIAGVHNIRKRRKKQAVEHKGGKCQRCGYRKSLNALQFHHLERHEKEFAISRWITLKWERIAIELDKCILVCANCHAEIHEAEDLARDVGAIPT